MDSTEPSGPIEMKRVGDIMIPLNSYPSVRMDETLQVAIAVIEDAELEVGLRRSLPRALLVFDISGDLVGVVRRRDLMRGLEPKFLVADEPVSMLDASLKVEILDLLVDLQKKHHFTQLMITHDLALTRYVADRIAIMYLGKIMELGPTRPVLADPYHPYTRALIKVVPTLDKAWEREEKAVLSGEIPHPSNMPPGCRFHPRCPKVTDIKITKLWGEGSQTKEGTYAVQAFYSDPDDDIKSIAIDFLDPSADFEHRTYDVDADRKEVMSIFWTFSESGTAKRFY